MGEIGGVGVEETRPEQEENKEKRTIENATVEKKTETKRRRTLLSIVIVLFFLLLFYQMMRWNNRLQWIENNIQQIESRVNEMSGTIGGLGNISAEVRSVLEEQASALASSNWDMKIIEKQVTPAEPTASTIPKEALQRKVELTMFAVPKEYVDGMEVMFYADCSDGTKVSVKGEQTETMSFTGKVEIPLCESVAMRVTLKKDGVTQIQEIAQDQVRDRMVLHVDGSWGGSYGYRGGTVNTEGAVSVSLDGNYEADLTPLQKVEVVIYTGGKQWKRLPMDVQEFVGCSGISQEVVVNETIPLEVGESLQMNIEAEDSNGFRYRKIVMKTKFKENGETVDEWHHTMETEVY